jgi:riboflavin synthase alpha subunit
MKSCCLVVLVLAKFAFAFVPTTRPTRGRNRLAPRHMFTGIVEEIGTVVSLESKDDMKLWDGSKGSGTELTVKGEVSMDGAYLGCSICVSGVCLTATELDFDKNIFKVGLAPETLRLILCP